MLFYIRGGEVITNTDEDIQLDLFLESRECEVIFEKIQSAIKDAYLLGLKKREEA